MVPRKLQLVISSPVTRVPFIFQKRFPDVAGSYISHVQSLHRAKQIMLQPQILQL